MVLVKCNCGCFYTLDMEGLNKDSRICPNCGEIHRFSGDTTVKTLLPGNLVGDGLEVVSIPNEAKVNIAFNI